MEKHYKDSIEINATPEAIFAYADDHSKFSSHMNESSWMMGGGKMETEVDEGHGQKIGSHIKMGGKVFGIKLFLDEVITEHESPRRKVWKTVGDLKLLVIGHYQLGFEIEPKENKSIFTVFIDYDLPSKNIWLGKLFGGIYAKWCVNQMISGVKNHFNMSH